MLLTVCKADSHWILPCLTYPVHSFITYFFKTYTLLHYIVPENLIPVLKFDLIHPTLFSLTVIILIGHTFHYHF